ncbi:MAG: IclR family transcriptional regulator [Chloroflexota bacterium]|nr:IclR family transcriptional regulator [Chloroflexota bacterium]
MERSPYFLESVDRVMKVLDCFDAGCAELRLTDLSVRLGMPKPQVLRIATTLVIGGYLERDRQTKRYRLGLRLFQLGMLVRQQMNLSRIADPVLRHLATRTDETVALFRADATGAICVEVIESPKGLRIFAQIGRTMPWNAGAAGKVILAHLPEPEREAILEADQFEQFTPDTVTAPDHLRRMLDEVRAAGYAQSAGDLDPDARGVSAPIFNANHRVAGALSVGGPRSRMTDAALPAMIELVRQGAAEVSRGLGYESNGNGYGPTPADVVGAGN